MEKQRDSTGPEAATAAGPEGVQRPEAGGPRRRALVTGASSGIGEAFAERLARDQYNLVLVARSAERLEALAKRLTESRGMEVTVLPADLTDPRELARVEAALQERTPDLLVNNAGFGTVGAFSELELENEEREIRLNALAPVRLTHAVLPRMVARGHGAVINVSSMACLQPVPYTATYGATKAFLTSFSEAVHEEVRESGVRVQALLPGFTRTEFQERAGIDDKRVPGFVWLSAERVVDASLAALERGDPVCIPGAGYRVLSGAQRLVPRGLLRRLYGAASRTSIR